MSIQILPAGITYNNNGNEEMIEGTIIEDISAPPDGYIYVSNKNIIKSAFKKDPTAKDFIQIIYPDLNGDGIDDVVTYTLNGLYMYDLSTNNNMLIATPSVVEPVIDGNSIRYPNIFTGSDLVFYVEPGRLKEEIQLQDIFMQILPDPFTINYNPDQTKVLIDMKISFNGNLVEDTNNVILCQNTNGDSNLSIQPITAMSVTGDLLAYHFYQQFDATTNKFLYGLAYNTTQRVQYPITIDPTISSTTGTNYGYILHSYDTYYGDLYSANTNASTAYLGYQSTQISV